MVELDDDASCELKTLTDEWMGRLVERILAGKQLESKNHSNDIQLGLLQQISGFGKQRL